MKATILAAFLVTQATAAGPGEPAVLANLARAHVTVDANGRQLLIELPDVDLPPAVAGDETMADLPPSIVVIPRAVSICRFEAQVLDSAGHVLPRVFLHHVNLNDPGRRDLFLPSQMHILAASKETPSLALPGLVLGLPLERDDHLVAVAMVSNPTATAYHRVHVRLKLGYAPYGPMFRAYPWGMDAMFPLGTRPYGSKAFDLPPGRTVKTWESSPAVPAYVLGIGGHVHDFATKLEFTDVTTGQVLWSQVPLRDSAGSVIELPITRFYNWHRLGVHIYPTHRYRITVTYDNPTTEVLTDGGMGAVGGLVVPERGVVWPQVDTTDAIYRTDLSESILRGDMSHMKMHMHADMKM